MSPSYAFSPSPDIMTVIQRSTWVRDFTFTDNTSNTLFGDSTYSAEFVLCNQDNQQEIYAISSTTNGKTAWLSDGVIRSVFSDSDTAGFNFSSAGFYLRVFRDGRSAVLLRGILSVIPASPVPNYSVSPSARPY